MYGLPDSVGGYYAKRLIKNSSSMRRGATRRGTAFGFSLVKLDIFKPELNMVLNTSNGNLWHSLEKRGKAIVRDAKKQAGFRTGALRSSIHMRHTGNVTGQYLWIGSTKSYAYAHHEGTKPHTITATNSPVLVFRSGARVIKTPTVNHPGNRPNPYLTTPMRKNLARPIIVR